MILHLTSLILLVILLYYFYFEKPFYSLIVKKLEKIMTTQSEFAAQLTTVTEQLVKIQSETTGLKQAILDLEEALANAPVTAELQIAFDALKAQAQVLDDLVPDVIPPVPDPEPDPDPE